MTRQRFIVLSNAVEGRETDYADWYLNQHLPDMIAIDGVIDGQAFTAARATAGWRFLGIYTVADGKIPEVMESIGRIRATGRMTPTDAIVPDSVAFLTADLIDEYRAPQASQARFRHLALTAARTDGQDDVDRWLKDHIPATLGAEYLRLRDDRRRGNPAWTRACIFWADDMSGSLDQTQDNLSSTCAALDVPNCYIETYERTSDLVSGS